MTNNQNSINFIYGMAILAKYRTDNFSINVIEQSAITVSGLKKIDDQEREDLKLFNWNIFDDDAKVYSFANYYQLEYVDT